MKKTFIESFVVAVTLTIILFGVSFIDTGYSSLYGKAPSPIMYPLVILQGIYQIVALPIILLVLLLSEFLSASFLNFLVPIGLFVELWLLLKIIFSITRRFRSK